MSAVSQTQSEQKFGYSVQHLFPIDSVVHTKKKKFTFCHNFHALILFQAIAYLLSSVDLKIRYFVLLFSAFFVLTVPI